MRKWRRRLRKNTEKGIKKTEKGNREYANDRMGERKRLRENRIGRDLER